MLEYNPDYQDPMYHKRWEEIKRLTRGYIEQLFDDAITVLEYLALISPLHQEVLNSCVFHPDLDCFDQTDRSHEREHADVAEEYGLEYQFATLITLREGEEIYIPMVLLVDLETKAREWNRDELKQFYRDVFSVEKPSHNDMDIYPY
ncbi:MAG: hypothetical protein ISS48_01885 [Candidatus Aenigmarchaeota archaeon]|nr:hypothetical protein [Candidatus Aenigmarchaeota archaeon]